MSDSAPLWRETPLIYSKHLSDRLGSSEYSVYLKLENLQPAHSFKSRGLSHFIKRKLEEHGPGLHAICASGGNAGLAAAAASQTLGVRCTIYLPEGVDSATRKYLAALGAKDVVVGSRYAEALVAAKNAVAEDADAVLIPAYEDRLIWEGHSTMVSEMKKQLNREPDAIFCSVGGAGLLGGIILGCKAESWDSVPIIAMETHGSNCFFETMAANRGEELASPENVTLRTDEASRVKIAHLSRLTSKAASLGASEATAGAVRLALDRPAGVRCATIPDEMSMQVSKAFADDHKILAELACATALAPAYSPKLMSCLVPPVQGRSRVVIFVVCGGFKISVDDLSIYAEVVKEDSSDAWMVRVDSGRQMTVSKLP